MFHLQVLYFQQRIANGQTNGESDLPLFDHGGLSVDRDHPAVQQSDQLFDWNCHAKAAIFLIQSNRPYSIGSFEMEDDFRPNFILEKRCVETIGHCAG